MASNISICRRRRWRFSARLRGSPSADAKRGAPNVRVHDLRDERGGEDFLFVCMEERGRERNSKSRTTAKPSPPSAVVRRTILEFEFLSRIIPFIKSMR